MDCGASNERAGNCVKRQKVSWIAGVIRICQSTGRIWHMFSNEAYKWTWCSPSRHVVEWRLAHVLTWPNGNLKGQTNENGVKRFFKQIWMSKHLFTYITLTLWPLLTIMGKIKQAFICIGLLNFLPLSAQEKFLTVLGVQIPSGQPIREFIVLPLMCCILI